VLLCCFWLHRVCATCCVANTARYRLHGMCLTASTREQACTYIPLCFAALIVQLHASYPDYCMHRVCAASRGSQVTGLQGHSDRQHIQPGTLMSDSILVTYWATCFGHIQLFAAICWLLLQPAQGLCSMPTQPGTGCKACLTASTHAKRRHNAYYHVVQKCKAN
jgi:hypothetical protein